MEKDKIINKDQNKIIQQQTDSLKRKRKINVVSNITAKNNILNSNNVTTIKSSEEFFTK